MPGPSILKKVFATIRATNSVVRRYNSTDPAMEIVYRELFLKELSELGLVDEYRPIGSAANHSLLYLVARVLREFEFRGILDLGAGQTSILIDRIGLALGREWQVKTIEHNEFWADKIQKLVRHEVLHAPLVHMTIAGHAIDYYALKPSTLSSIELLIVDGPPASEKQNRYSRLGILPFIPSILAEDYLIVIDDVERKGEADLVAQLSEALAASGRSAKMKLISASKKQAILASGKYLPALYV